MKLIRKKKYKELLATIDHYESKIKYLEGALSNLDSYSCQLRKQKYSYELSIQELRKRNRRLINLLYNPKKK